MLVRRDQLDAKPFPSDNYQHWGPLHSINMSLQHSRYSWSMSEVQEAVLCSTSFLAVTMSLGAKPVSVHSDKMASSSRIGEIQAVSHQFRHQSSTREWMNSPKYRVTKKGL
ncbi:hypothetical protein KIL84_000914 [Mauremys mutica]|uniref:Uncharacterized protein n=1 Tax=Mauremys mutica TaxID=74926 RepID=A0A9D3WTJ4_9SAUR|nr:hypothetical protein KIL84_000914 [Mauremys mutica]